ncbi:MAG: chemotaxis protein CheX [Deltaproteobacteria bacterium]|nr:chemotaxis protein CheX [Deltaproteobacteria bacterium]
MNVEYINPFLDSMINVLSSMAYTQATPEKPFVKNGKGAFGDVTGIIGIAGPSTKGSLAITFPEPVILMIASKMLGEDYSQMEPIVIDMVSEIANMVLGGAKKVLSEKGYRFDMSIPSTIMGKDHTITHKTKGNVIVVPFNTEQGQFFIEITFE